MNDPFYLLTYCMKSHATPDVNVYERIVNKTQTSTTNAYVKQKLPPTENVNIFYSFQNRMNLVEHLRKSHVSEGMCIIYEPFVNDKQHLSVFLPLKQNYLFSLCNFRLVCLGHWKFFAHIFHSFGKKVSVEKNDSHR